MTVFDGLEPVLRAAALAYLQAELDEFDDASDLADPEQLTALCVRKRLTVEEAVQRARLILLAVDAARALLPPQPRPSGPLSVADAQALRLDLGADAVALIAWMPGADDVALALSASGNRSVARRCSAAQFSAVSATIATLIPSPASSSPSES